MKEFSNPEQSEARVTAAKADGLLKNSFEDRKQDHITISLSEQSQSRHSTGLEKVELIHEALPEIDFSQVSLEHKTLGLEVSSPLFVSSMTLGHQTSAAINDVLARVCSSRNILMGVGSQRRQLNDLEAAAECRTLRSRFPRLKILGNLGLSQLIRTNIDDVRRLADSLEAQAMIIHTNPLQECIQPEGTPEFKGGLRALTDLCRNLDLPVVLKETGSGFSAKTLKRLSDVGLAAIDVSGKGGTHWGRVEAQRLKPSDVRAAAGLTFADWGETTLASIQAATQMVFETGCATEVWASGGVRSGLDAAKLLALGANMVGVAQPVLAAALKGEETLNQLFDGWEYELKVALFCTGHVTVADLQRAGVVRWT